MPGTFFIGLGVGMILTVGVIYWLIWKAYSR